MQMLDLSDSYEATASDVADAVDRMIVDLLGVKALTWVEATWPDRAIVGVKTEGAAVEFWEIGYAADDDGVSLTAPVKLDVAASLPDAPTPGSRFTVPADSQVAAAGAAKAAATRSSRVLLTCDPGEAVCVAGVYDVDDSGKAELVTTDAVEVWGDGELAAKVAAAMVDGPTVEDPDAGVKDAVRQAAAAIAAEVKIGRALSGVNAAAVRAAYDALGAVLVRAGLLTPAEPDADDAGDVGDKAVVEEKLLDDGAEAVDAATMVDVTLDDGRVVRLPETLAGLYALGKGVGLLLGGPLSGAAAS